MKSGECVLTELRPRELFPQLSWVFPLSYIEFADMSPFGVLCTVSIA